MPNADVYCTGSDQVWAKIGGVNYDEAYFLNFVPEGKRCISYAASLGKSKIDEELEKKLQAQMDKTIEALKYEFSTIRAGRANAQMLDKIRVDYYGTPTPLQQVGNVSVPEARMICIQPWDASILKDIEHAINMSDVGINPTNDGKVIRLVFPELTEDRRKELVKDVKKKGENAKVAIRNIRRDAIDAIKKKGKEDGISEDEVKGYQDDVQKKTDEYIKKIDVAIEEKSNEIMTV